MAKKRGMIDLTTKIDAVGPVVPVEPRGHVVPVRRGEQTRHLQDDRWLPLWLVWWLRRRRSVLLVLAVGLGVGAWAVWRMLAVGR